MKKYKIKLWIIIIILCIMLINNGCLTMQYYPARVAKPGKILLGVGLNIEGYEEVKEEYGSSGGWLFSGIFIRYGLSNNIDIGFGIHSTLILPYILSIGARKQFDLNNNSIDSVVLEAMWELGLLFNGFYTSISTIRNKFAFTVGGQIITGEKPAGSTPTYYSEIGLLIKVSNEHQYGRFSVMPFSYYRITKEYYDYYSEIFQEIGTGISFYFDLL